MRIKIFLATKNKAKYPYMKKFCDLLNCKFVTPYNINKEPDFEEKGKTIQENAEIKALNWSYYTGALVLADDSGFDIPALKGKWRKELSKRNVGGDEISDEGKRRKLLELMKDLKGEEGKIIWTEAIALAHKGKLISSISLDSTRGYIVEHIDPKNKAIEGAFLSNLEYKPQFGKVYSELNDKEIEENDKEMFDRFRKFVKEKIENYLKNSK
jgi:XTP/dITP diphosphohydrolase